MQPETAAYLAGLLDGEGHITLQVKDRRSAARRLVVTITNTDLALLVWVREQVGAGCIRRMHTADLVSRDCHRWEVKTRQAEQFLRTIQPYLIAKRAQVALALAYRAQPEAELLAQLRALTRRGPG